MLTGTVKSLAITGRGKKIYRSGDPVTEENFPEGNFKKLVSDGHIILGESVKNPVTITDAVEEAKLKEKERLENEAAEADAAEAEKVAKETAELNELKVFCDSESISYTEDITLEGIKELLENLTAEKAAKAFDDAKAEATELGVEYDDDSTIEDILAGIASIKTENELKDAEKAIAEFKGKDFTSEKGAVRTVKSIADINVKELNFALKASGLKYNTNSSKTILFFKWISLK